MNKGLVFIAISGIVAALILATVVPVQVSAAGRGQEGIDKGREASGNTHSCQGLNEASSHNAGTVSPCPLIP